MNGNAFDMDEAYGAMRPHQRGLFNMLGMAAVGGKKLIDAGANAFDTVGRIMGYGDPVTMDEVRRAADDASMFAMPGTMARSRIAPRDEYMATKFRSTEPVGDSFRGQTPATTPANYYGRRQEPQFAPYINDPYEGVPASVQQLVDRIRARGPVSPIAPPTQQAGQKPFTAIPGGGANGGYHAAVGRQSRSIDADGWAPTGRTQAAESELRTLNAAARDLNSQPDPRTSKGMNAQDRAWDVLNEEQQRLADLIELSYLKPVK